MSKLKQRKTAEWLTGGISVVIIAALTAQLFVRIISL